MKEPILRLSNDNFGKTEFCLFIKNPEVGRMRPKRAIRLLVGVVLLALYELLPDGSGVGMKERWNKLKGWAEK